MSILVRLYLKLIQIFIIIKTHFTTVNEYEVSISK